VRVAMCTDTKHDHLSPTSGWYHVQPIPSNIGYHP